MSTKNKQTQQKDKKFITKHVKADSSVEYVVQKSPAKTWWGKTIVILVVVGTVVVPIVALIWSLFK